MQLQYCNHSGSNKANEQTESGVQVPAACGVNTLNPPCPASRSSDLAVTFNKQGLTIVVLAAVFAQVE